VLTRNLKTSARRGGGTTAGGGVTQVLTCQPHHAKRNIARKGVVRRGHECATEKLVGSIKKFLRSKKGNRTEISELPQGEPLIKNNDGGTQKYMIRIREGVSISSKYVKDGVSIEGKHWWVYNLSQSGACVATSKRWKASKKCSPRRLFPHRGYTRSRRRCIRGISHAARKTNPMQSCEKKKARPREPRVILVTAIRPRSGETLFATERAST